ncbi:MAG TPA: prepilin-type N-terminal cleavage/methylation domain-containing protein [Candidatus Binataceae bacterium]|nr:prepilin-type N-terminal cleavage/methylation domain-containing protein [Candidatus Binataceae bacterium]
MKLARSHNRSRTTSYGRSSQVTNARRIACGFTLLEVMIAVAFIGIAMLALLTLHNRNLHSVIGAQEMSRAVVLAQAVMAQAETERYPDLGTTSGDFQKDYPGKYPGYRWQRQVASTPGLQDLRTVTVRVFYGNTGSRIFELDEIMHNPTPTPPPQAAGNAQNNGAGSD